MNQRKTIRFPFSIDPLTLIENNPETVSFLNSNEKGKENILAWGKGEELKLDSEKGAFDTLSSFRNKNQDWMMGYISYDLKNDLEDLTSERKNDLEFPLLHFFIPKLIIHIHPKHTIVEYINGFLLEKINDMIHGSREKFIPSPKKELNILFHGPDEKEYIKHFDVLSEHIQQGDIYEVNYCLEFKANEISIDPLTTYFQLNEQTKAPFSVYYQDEGNYLLCGSPERYLKKDGNKILSQPIKGTIKRGSSSNEDELLKRQLKEDPKEQAENVMIVDLVRNDLSKIANKGSVNVDELFGVYSFKTVHQLISSVSCEVDEALHPVEIIKATFPMGSMTGAPKISAMKIIEEHEDFQRGIYSGAFGYFKPNGDFDFNVVIRSILYNEKKRLLSFPVGGAITSLAKAKNEYHECILKAKAMKKALQNNG